MMSDFFKNYLSLLSHVFVPCTYMVYVGQASVYVRACCVHYHKRGNRSGEEQERTVVERRLTMFKTRRPRPLHGRSCRVNISMGHLPILNDE